MKGSNRPGQSRSPRKTTSLPPLGPNLPSLFGRGITSMLRTETELGDLGDIVFGNLSGSSSIHHHAQWQGASSSMSAMSSPFSRASKSFPGHSSSSSAPRDPTAPHGPQYGSPPAMPNLPSSSLGMIENRDRDPNRLQSTTYTMQSLNSDPANRSHTNLRHAQNLQPQNSHTRLVSRRGGPGSSMPNNRSTSLALNDNIGLPSQASQNFEGQRPLTGRFSHTYANTGYPHNSRGQSNLEQEQPYRGPGQPHNIGKMRVGFPYQPASRGLEGRHGELEPFPPFDDTVYDERLATHANRVQSRRNRSEDQHVDQRSEAFALPSNHKQIIAIEQADFKRFAAGPVPSNSTCLPTNSDALSSDTTASPVSDDSRSVEVLRHPGGMEEMELKDTSLNDKTASNPNVAGDPGQSKEDRVPGGPADSLGDGSDAPIDELCGNGTPLERHDNISEHVLASTSRSMKSSPLVPWATSDHAQKSGDEQSFKSCTGIPNKSPGPVRPGSGRDCKENPASTPNFLLQRKYLLNPDAYSCSTAKGADGSDCVDVQSSPQSHASSQTRENGYDKCQF